MTQKYPDGEKVVAPGTVIVSAAGEVSNIRQVAGTNEPGVQTRSSCNIHKASPPAGPGSAPHPGWAREALPKLLRSQKVLCFVFVFKCSGESGSREVKVTQGTD